MVSGDLQCYGTESGTGCWKVLFRGAAPGVQTVACPRRLARWCSQQHAGCRLHMAFLPLVTAGLLTGLLAATCGTMLDSGVLAVGHGTVSRTLPHVFVCTASVHGAFGDPHTFCMCGPGHSCAVDFLALYTGTGPWGSCPQGHGSHNSVRSRACQERLVRPVSCQNHHHPLPPPLNGKLGTTSEVLPQHKRVRIGET